MDVVVVCSIFLGANNNRAGIIQLLGSNLLKKIMNLAKCRFKKRR